jgi:hypothetical protein
VFVPNGIQLQLMQAKEFCLGSGFACFSLGP